MPSSVPRLAENDLREILEAAEPSFRELRGGRLFITGGTGFFGMWLLESLAYACEELHLDVQAVALTRDADRFRRKAPHLADLPWLSFRNGDVRALEPGTGTFTHTIHAATDASATLNREKPALQLNAVLEGTRRALAFSEQAGVGRFLFTSSGAVYGTQPPSLARIPETYLGAPDPTLPDSAYGEGKRIAELLCVLSSMEAIIARCFAFVGAHLPLDTTYAVGNFLRDATNGDPVRVGGDGTPFRSLMYGTDLAIWLWTLLVAAPADRAYNVGSPLEITVESLAERVAALPDPPLKVVLAREPVPGAPAGRYLPDVRRAQEELALTVRVPLEEALRRTYDWLSKGMCS